MRIVWSVIAAFLVFAGTAGGLDPGVSAAAKPIATKKKAKPKRTNLKKSQDLWATVNVCDTEGHPNTIGIRGSMPGLGNQRTRLQMRFRVQYKATADGKWHTAQDNADSGWLTIGATARQVIESGRDFVFKPPTDGGAHILRGQVTFRWRSQGKVITQRTRFTETGHKKTLGADPKDFTAAECDIKQP